MDTQEIELKHLRYFVAVLDSGSFTDAALALRVSQAAVSRTIAAFESRLGVRLIHRTSREVAPTSVGIQVLARARLLLKGVDELVSEASTGHSRINLGHAWSAFGEHTTEFQRRWATQNPGVDLRLVRNYTATGGLAEGRCDLAVVRAPLDLKSWAHALIGHEPRYVAVASDDPWARRRYVRFDEIRSRTIAVDERTGTSHLSLWPSDARPQIEPVREVDDWLDAISSGRCIGMTTKSTADAYRRAGVVYRPIRDAEPVSVYMIWRANNTHPATHAAVALAQELYRGGEYRHSS